MTHWFYLALDIGTFLCPLCLSFDSNVAYRKSWISAFLASLIIAVPFLIWDVIFTENGFWGFNPEFISGIYIFNLPLEEVLFFILIPFACTFIYEVCKHFFRNWNVSALNRIFFLFIPLYALTLVLIDDYGYYTLSVVISSSLVLFWLLSNPTYRFAPLAFIISIIPFLIVNGALTGSFTDEPVVWYSEAQKISYRIFTIPMEDILYSFTMVVGNIIVFEKLKAKIKI
ncbi:MAG: lycopene cyclase domain-containing protein [Crocinitomicaceae bacterium]|nr:lycopene cyclase domain-containing protein [Crocinitomicaceae bacterium]